MVLILLLLRNKNKRENFAKLVNIPWCKDDFRSLLFIDYLKLTKEKRNSGS